MKEVSINGVDLAKKVFQLHGAAADGSVLFRKKLSRPQFQRFMAEHPQCLVALEACGGSHHWARELVQAGHEVKLIAPRYVKPFIKYGFSAPEGIGYLPRLGAVLEDPSSVLPLLARENCCELLDQIVHLTGRINAMKKRIDAIAREGETSRRLQTMPGVGPISALAVETFAPPMEQPLALSSSPGTRNWLSLIAVMVERPSAFDRTSAVRSSCDVI